MFSPAGHPEITIRTTIGITRNPPVFVMILVAIFVGFGSAAGRFEDEEEDDHEDDGAPLPAEAEGAGGSSIPPSRHNPCLSLFIRG